jgi:hypothetical protein
MALAKVHPLAQEATLQRTKPIVMIATIFTTVQPLVKEATLQRS